MRRRTTALWLTFAVLCGASCSVRVPEFATEPGECYTGTIVKDEFVRAGFSSGARMWLSLDPEALSDAIAGAIVLSTSDQVFLAAPGETMPQLRHDSLSLLDFPGGRVRNYLAYARPTEGEAASVVLSLMENGRVEVRVMRPDSNAQDDLDDSLFGVFRLDIDDGCPFQLKAESER